MTILYHRNIVISNIVTIFLNYFYDFLLKKESRMALFQLVTFLIILAESRQPVFAQTPQF